MGGGPRRNRRGEQREIPLPYFHCRRAAIDKRQIGGKSRAASVAATIINGMKPQIIGRTLGTGLRIAGRIAGQSIAAGAQAAASQPASQPAARTAGKVAGRATRSFGRGIGGFLKPFRRVGGILWLEVTGTFFFLFVVVFARFAWITRMDYARGPNHLRFLVYSGVALVFLYLTVSSFWRARRK